MKTLKETEVLFIGLGHANGTAAMVLAKAGVDCVGLEAGPRLLPTDFVPDEIRMQNRNWLANAKANWEVPTYRSNASVPATRAPWTRATMQNTVGGTFHWSAMSWRLTPWNFKIRSQAIAKYGPNVIPAGSTVADWPLDYDDLEPYYDKVEYLHGVSGKAGNIQGKIDPAGNIYEAPRRREYPLPPLRETGVASMFKTAATSLGWHPYIGPAGIRSKAYGNLPGCQYHGFCSGYGCHVDAKAATNVTGIPEAEKSGHLKVVTGAWVTRILVDKQGRATGAVYAKSGQEYFQPAKVVMLGAYTWENVRLLLLSKSSAYPNGLSNNHGQVGKHYASNDSIPGSLLHGLFPGQKLNTWYGNGAQYMAADDFEGGVIDSGGQFISHGAIMAGGSELHAIAASSTVPPGVPSWGPVWKDWIKKNANSVSYAKIMMDVLTYEQNYLDLDPVAKDPMGDPVIRITYGAQANEQRAWNFYRQKLTQLLMEAGASQVWGPGANGFAVTPRGSHAVGGARMGTDPDVSVVDPWGFSHEVPNLAVTGGATIPSANGRNPTETIWALSWRTADHLVQNWKTIAT
jgi:gluconate 2-dehydrogenase alpha chain